MKRQVIVIMLMLAGGFFLGGCIGTCPVMPPKTPIYCNYKAPLTLNINQTKLGSKTGRATCTSVMALFTSGDASIAAAAKDGGITTINHVDYEYTNAFGFMYQKFTVIAYGD